MSVQLTDLDKITQENIVIAKEIRKVLEELLKRLNMEDWDIKLAYEPNKDKEDCAEVAELYAHYKSAKIICIQEKSSTWEEILFHELMHCKLGTLTKNYTEALDKMMELVQNIITNGEEQVVEDLTKCFHEGKKNGLGKLKTRTGEKLSS